PLTRADDAILLSVVLFHDAATPTNYTLSLHDALPILARCDAHAQRAGGCSGQVSRPSRRYHEGQNRVRPGGRRARQEGPAQGRQDRKSTRLNSSHVKISYAVFCLKKKRKLHSSVKSHG